MFFWVGISKAWTCFYHLPLSGSTRSSTHHGNETKAKDATRSRKRIELSLQGETALCIKVHACVDVWSLCFYFSLSFFFIATTRVLATQKEWRFELTSPCVFVQSQRSLLSYIYQCLVTCVSAGEETGLFSPLMSFIYPYISFCLCNARTSILWLRNARGTKRFSSSAHSQKALDPRIHQLTDSVPSTNPSCINKSTSPFKDMEFFSSNLNHKVNPCTKNLC